MKFQPGNKVAADPGRKAVAETIRKRLEREGDSMPLEEVSRLGRVYSRLTAKRHRRKNKAKKKAEAAPSFNWRAEPTADGVRAMELRLEAENRQATPEELNYMVRFVEAERKAARANQTPKTSADATPEAESQPVNDGLEKLKREARDR